MDNKVVSFSTVATIIARDSEKKPSIMINQCPICLLEYREKRRLSCGHEFCSRCVTMANFLMKTTFEPKCPLCRRQISREEHEFHDCGKFHGRSSPGSGSSSGSSSPTSSQSSPFASPSTSPPARYFTSSSLLSLVNKKEGISSLLCRARASTSSLLPHPSSSPLYSSSSRTYVHTDTLVDAHQFGVKHFSTRASQICSDIYGDLYVSDSSIATTVHKFSGNKYKLESVLMKKTICSSAKSSSRADNCKASINRKTTVRTTSSTPAEDPFGHGQSPRAVAVSMNLNIVICDSENHCVRIYCQYTGFLKLTFGGRGVEEGRLWYPSAVAIDLGRTNNIIVSDSGNDRIQIFSSEGKFLRALYGFNEPRGISVNRAGYIFVADRGNERIVVLDCHGNPANKIDCGRHKLHSPIDVQVSHSQEEIYVINEKSRSISVFSIEGEFQEKICLYKRGDAPSSECHVDPVCVAATRDGGLAVVDGTTDEVLLFHERR